MALYSYSRYNINRTYKIENSRYYDEGRGWPVSDGDTLREVLDDLVFSTSTGYITLPGTSTRRWPFNLGTLGKANAYKVINSRKVFRLVQEYSSATGEYYNSGYYIEGVVTSETRGSFVSTITAEDGAYPTNGISGSYWYVRGAIVTPSAPSNITVPTEIKGGKDITITWGTSNYVTRYHLERQINNGTWEEIYQGTNREYTDNVPRGIDFIRYRVRVYGNSNYSAYTNSPVRSVKSFPDTTIKIDGQVKTGVRGWVRVNGQLFDLSEFKARVDGTLREL